LILALNFVTNLACIFAPSSHIFPSSISSNKSASFSFSRSLLLAFACAIYDSTVAILSSAFLTH
jgi:hypothetical protein